jgi:hypothetical protein
MSKGLLTGFNTFQVKILENSSTVNSFSVLPLRNIFTHSLEENELEFGVEPE